MAVDDSSNPFKRRRKPFDNDFFGGGSFGFDFDEIMEHMARMLEDFNNADMAGKNKKYVYGFQMQTGPDGKPMIEEFGNIPKGKGLKGGKEFPSDEREPLVDVIDGKEEVTVIAELPGVNKEDIDLKTDDNTLTIKVDNDSRRYFKELELPAKIKSDSVKANYKNGILEVKLKRAEKQKDERKRIKID